MLTTKDIARIKNKIAKVLKDNASIAPARTKALLPLKSLQGKLYEAHVLAVVCENLVKKEGLTITLIGSGKLMLRQKGGPINRTYPYFQVWKGTALLGELFTDLYFDTLSYYMRGSPTLKAFGDYHELDIAIIEPGISDHDHPKHSQVILAIECKNTTIEKSIIRELLGFRRELSLYGPLKLTSFNIWPAKEITATPSSVHMLYCSDKGIKNYVNNCTQFGILLEYFKM